MATKTGTTGNIRLYRKTLTKRRPGITCKNKNGKIKGSKNYKKPYRKQGR